jgi:hypothetical protein
MCCGEVGAGADNTKTCTRTRAPALQNHSHGNHRSNNSKTLRMSSHDRSNRTAAGALAVRVEPRQHHEHHETRAGDLR